MSDSKQDKVIGFIGLGLMGRHMAGHLLKAGYSLNVYDRVKASAEELMAKGAVWRSSVAELAAASRMVITIIGFPKDVEEVYFGPAGVIENAQAGARIIDMTTSSPELARRIYAAAAERGLAALDAPVSGNAPEALLSIMVGGDGPVFEEIKPIFEVMGKTVVFQGPAGSGQHCKMCNQIAIAANMMGVCEAISYARKNGLDPENVLSSIKNGAAGSAQLTNMGPRMIKGDFQPGFFVKNFIKDLEIAAASSRSRDLDTPALELALSMYHRLRDLGHENLGTQALLKLYLDD